MASRYTFQIQRLIDDLGTGQLGGLTSWDVDRNPYPLFDSKAKAEAYIRRHGLIARWQRYAVNKDGSRGWTAGAGSIIDARQDKTTAPTYNPPRRRRR
jgi:hypothetical protein